MALRGLWRVSGGVVLFSKVPALRALKKSLKSLTGKPFWLRYLTLAPYRAVCAASSVLTGRTMSGAAHAGRNVDEAINYITSVFHMYKAAAGVTRFQGRVAEIGPGDSCGIGLMFLADGCNPVHLVDRFFSVRDENHQQEINQALVRQFPALRPQLKNGDFSEKSFNNLARYYGETAAAEVFFKINLDYDFIVSCAVLEHVYDPLGALTAMVAALRPGGTTIHQIDCRDHGQFSERFHELKFLELPPALYAPLKWGGGPNRIRLDQYVKLLRILPVDYQIYVDSLAGIEEFMPPGTPLERVPKETLERSRDFVRRVRNRLSGAFRELADEDLMIQRFTLVAKKRPAPNP